MTADEIRSMGLDPAKMPRITPKRTVPEYLAWLGSREFTSGDLVKNTDVDVFTVASVMGQLSRSGAIVAAASYEGNRIVWRVAQKKLARMAAE